MSEESSNGMIHAGSVEHFLSAAFLRRLESPLEQSTGLPNAAYIDPLFLKLENERVFRRSWILAGFQHEIPHPGDVVPITVANLPLILVRDEQGDIRAFHNVCRHRGTRLVDKPCRQAKLLRCPYHHWTYNLDGHIRNRPHFYGPDQHDTPTEHETRIRLSEVRCGVWHDIVCVNLDGRATTFEEYIRPAVDRLAHYDFSALRYAGSLDFELKCNWKLIHENFVEPYHVFAVHPGLLKFGPMSQRRASEFENTCLWNDYEFPAPEQGRGMGLPHYPGLDERHQRLAMWFHLFPTLSFEIFPDQFAVIQLTPVTPERTHERIHIYLVGDAATAPEYEQARTVVFDTWRNLNAEDVEVVELLQAGRHSPGFDGGVLSPYWDGATRQFARLIANAMTRADN